MSSCSQNFKNIFTELSKEKGLNLFKPFSNEGVYEMSDIDTTIDIIATEAIRESEESGDPTMSYNFKEARAKLESMTKKFPFLSSDHIENILSSMKVKLNFDADAFLTNPLVKNEDGTSSPMYDFDNLSDLVGNVHSMETYIEQELENGLFKAIFINNSENYKFGEDNLDIYEPFVVNDVALNKNLNIYKNELWSYIVNASGLEAKDIVGSKLFVNNVLNKGLFTSNDGKPSVYTRVMGHIKKEMDTRFESPDAYKHIRIYTDNKYSMAQAYSKSLILANFDNFVLSKHATKVALNYDSINTFSSPTNDQNKYKLTFKWAKAISIDNSEKADDIDKNSSSLIKMLSNIIQYYEKVNKNGVDKWVPVQGLTIGKSNFDSIGAILNGINPKFKIILRYTVPKGGRLIEEIVNVSIGEAFKLYDSEKIDFSTILTGLIEAAPYNNELNSREAVLVSLHKFLYSQKGGIVNTYNIWKANHPEFADFVVSAEVALINHIRNTVKHVYRTETKGDKGKTLDVLNIETTVGEDFEELVGNLSVGWSNSNVSIKDLDNVVDYDSYFKFLSNPSKGGIILSNRARERFTRDHAIDFGSEAFKKEFKKLLSHSESGMKTTIPKEAGEEVGYTSLQLEEITEKLKSKEVESVLKLRELFKLKHFAEKYNILTQIKDSNRNSLPTMGIANLASLYNLSIATAPSFNLFKENADIYNGIEILQEVVGRNDSTNVNELNGVESFKLGFTRHFLMSGINEGKTIIQPWNFSDKPKIFGVGINNDATFAPKIVEGKEVIKSFRELNSNELQDEFFARQKQYYNQLILSVFTDFGKLDPEFINWSKNTSNITALERIEKIEEYLNKVNTKGELLERINKVFQKDGNSDMEIVEDLHYSVYYINGEPKVKFNRLLKGNIQLFNNKKLFNKWAKQKEDSLLNFLKTEVNISLGEITIKNKFVSKKNKLVKISEYFGVPEDSILTAELDAEGNPKDITNASKLNYVDDKGNLSPLFAKYLWSKNLVVSQYANLTTKDAFLHPNKVQDFKPLDLNNEEDFIDFIEEENIRTTGFTKRMNIPGASMITYGKGVHGMSLKIKIAAKEDPKAPVFNYEGLNKRQDVEDGGGTVNPFFNELMIWSLPGLDLKRTQKPIGESINNKFATTLKFATFAINNEEVRNSLLGERASYIEMKKMNSIDLYNTGKDGVIYQNIMETTDASGVTEPIDVSAFFDNIWIPIDGVYVKLTGLVWIPGTNKYNLVYEKNHMTESIETEINTLFDLWEAFGGAFSKKLENGRLIYTEDSINLVSSIIKKHSLTKSSLKLKDKMIAMLLPQTAIKKGAANVNSLKNVYSNDNNLSWFNFDTSFFGVQLTAFHSTDESDVNEITQVMSGIAENAATPELYNSIYDAVGTLVENGLNKFNLNVSKTFGVQKIVDLFVKKVNNSSQINNSRTIINGIVDKMNKEIPIGNKTIYKQFVSHVISNINLDFIRRKFPGSGSILNPSYGKIKLFEDKYGKKYLVPDILELFDNLTTPDKELFVKTLNETVIPETNKKLSETEKNKQKIHWYINYSSDFKEEPISPSAIEPLDFIKLSENIVLNGREILAGEVIELKDIKDFFIVKELISAEPKTQVYRTYSQVRDLKPVRITFTTEGVKRSIYDTDAIKFSFWLQNNKKRLIAANLNSEDLNDAQFIHFRNYVYSVDSSIKTLSADQQYKKIQEYSGKWTQRTFELLSGNNVFKNYTDVTPEAISKRKNPFDLLFEYTHDKKTYTDNFTARFDKNNVYTYSNSISDYEHKRAENIHTNVHKGSFLIEDVPLAKVNERYFHKNLKEFAAINPPSGTPYDVILSDYNTKSSMYVAIEGNKYYERDGKLYDQVTEEEVGSKVYINEEVQPDGRKVRLSNYGKKMYTLPYAYSMFKDGNGNEIILVKGNKKYFPIENYTEFLKGMKNINVIKFNDFQNHKVNLRSYNASDNLLSLIRATISGTDNTQLRKYLEIKQTSYLKFKETVTTLEDEDLSKKYASYVKGKENYNTSDKRVLDSYLEKLAKVVYHSWTYSLESLSARIPAQAMQSFMSMDTVGFLSGDANDIYVSHWQLWLQGSDFDIDKLYMMMYDFDSGIFAGWSPFFDITKKESFNLPIPTARKYEFKDLTETIPFTPIVKESYAEGSDGNEVLVEEEILPIADNTLNIDALLNPSDSYLINLIVALKALKKNPNIIYIESSDPNLVRNINYHNSFWSESGFKNFIVHNLVKTSDSAVNQFSSYSPITFGPYEKIKEELGDQYKLGLYDGHTMGKQQEQNSVGKKVIAIAATGLKNYFGLVKYYSDLYENIESVNTLDNSYFLKQFTLGDKKITSDKISGLNISRQANEILKAQLKSSLAGGVYMKEDGTLMSQGEIEAAIEQIIKVKPDQDVALSISSILSLATDNAKELMLAKINAGIDFAGMHIYLLMMGVDVETVAKYMTSENALKIKSKLSRDFFASDFNASIPNKLSKMSPQKSGVDAEFLKEFIRIYNHSSELTSLGSIFKVNQGSKATQEDLYKLTLQFQSIINNQEKGYFKNFVGSKTSDFTQASDEEKFAYIVQDKPYLATHDKAVLNTLSKSRELGIANKGKLDVYRYFNDEVYRKVATDYYNLIKYTFNLFDVMNNLPHFYQMFKAFVDGEKFLIGNVNKYKFLKESISEVIDLAVTEKELDSWKINSEIKAGGDLSGQTVMGQGTIAKVNDYYDYYIIRDFTKTLDFEIDLGALMQYLKIEKIKLLEYDKVTIRTSEFTSNNLPFDTISLSTEYGLAQFRYIMDNYLISSEKNKYPRNGFLNNYTFNIHKNYNLKNKINYYMDRSNFSDLEDVEIGMSLLTNKSNIETDSELSESTKDYTVFGKLTKDGTERFKLIDLLTLYDLIINEGRFGGNRSTIFFSKDLKDKSSIARKFVEFQKKKDADKEYPDTIKAKLLNDINERQIFYFQLFGEVVRKNKDQQRVAKLVTDSDGNAISKLEVNRYFNILDNMENVQELTEFSDLSKKFLKLLKSEGKNILLNC